MVPRDLEASARRTRRLGGAILPRILLNPGERADRWAAASRPELSQLEKDTLTALSREDAVLESLSWASALTALSVGVLNWVYDGGVHLDTPSAVLGATLGGALLVISGFRNRRAERLLEVEHQMQDGDTFREGYTNWLGVDQRAVDRHYRNLGVQVDISPEVVRRPTGRGRRPRHQRMQS